MKLINKKLINRIRDILFAIYWHLTFFRPRNRAFGKYANYNEAFTASKTDYSDEELVSLIYRANKNVISGKYPYERDGVNYKNIQYSYQLNMHVCSLVNEKKNEDLINILDFGGGLGTTYRQFPFKNKINRWSIIEQDRILEIGTNEFCNEKLSFSSLEQLTQKSNYDVLIFGAVIDFIDDYQAVIKELIYKCKPQMIIVDRTLFTDLTYDFWTVKDTNKNITGHKKYPLCFISEIVFNSFMLNHGYQKIDSWLTSDKKMVSGMKVGNYKGFCYKIKSSL